MQQAKLFAFVLMPFDPAFDDIYKLGIKGAVKEFDDLIAERVDEQIYREGILDRIYRQIEVADMVIADMSGQNPNVFYEVGYAHAKGKLCILLTSDAADIPFDLKHQRHIVYGQSIITLRNELQKEIAWARDEIEKQRTSHVKVTLQTLDGSGGLDVDKFFARAVIRFVIDLENVSIDRSVTINAIYFFSTSHWTLHQDQKECAFTAADGAFLARGSKRKHFIQPPIQILQKGAWAQLKFEARRVLATSLKGEPFQSSYLVRGISTLRLLTTDGDFDYDLPIDVEVTDLPF